MTVAGQAALAYENTRLASLCRQGEAGRRSELARNAAQPAADRDACSGGSVLRLDAAQPLAAICTTGSSCRTEDLLVVWRRAGKGVPGADHVAHVELRDCATCTTWFRP